MPSIFLTPPGLIAALLCTLLLGCDKAPVPAAPAAGSAQAPGSPAVAALPAAGPAETALNAGDKLQGYVQCYNQIDEQAHRTISRYNSWVKDMKIGPTGNEKVVYGLYQISSDNIAKCRTVFAQTAAQKPPLAALDAAGAAYMDALASMDKLIADAYIYYDRENYKDDKFAKGQALHGPLAGSFNAFIKASEGFSDALDAENDVFLNAQLADIEKTQGRKLPYFQVALMNKAKHLTNAIESEKFDAAKAADLLGTFEKITDEAVAYAKANQGELTSSWSGFERATEDLRKAAKERVRRVRDNTPYTEGEKMMLTPSSGWMVDGSVGKLIKAYNALVTASNSM